MNERLVVFSFSSDQLADADGVQKMVALKGMTIVGVDAVATTLSGTPTAATLDIQDDGTDVIAGLDIGTAGTPATWKSTAFGGSNAPVAVAADSAIEIDLNLTAGSTPKATFHCNIWALLSE